MDARELANAKKLLGETLRRYIREFEQKTGLNVVGLKPIHDGGDMCSDVMIKAELP